ncbi:MAG: hypothetical protein ABIP53_00525 [Candidatus Limnocylindrales bacterium]
MDYRTFAAHVNSEFRVASPSGEVDDEIVLLLIDVAPLLAQPGAPRAEPFSLIFVGPRATPLPQATYSMRHSAIGDLEIFIVPIEFGDGGAIRYEAVFN